jgi:hypothetical protein
VNRTYLAAIQAAGAALLLIAGTGAIAGLGIVPSLVAGLVAGALAALLLVGAARRAGTLRDDPPRPGHTPQAAAEHTGTTPTDDVTTEDDDRG